ncbi:hypothetical protein RRG08_009161 [Elysia crispata]|uniref:Uncharacterized protein n=1 Tax=Elysia crispata TaxID=231223 RepID=A0AAE1B3N5_9GAST|nr:hypothetical protein RRG08_009161 [Elysia crispata]
MPFSFLSEMGGLSLQPLDSEERNPSVHISRGQEHPPTRRPQPRIPSLHVLTPTRCVNLARRQPATTSDNQCPRTDRAAAPV